MTEALMWAWGKGNHGDQTAVVLTHDALHVVTGIAKRDLAKAEEAARAGDDALTEFGAGGKLRSRRATRIERPEVKAIEWNPQRRFVTISATDGTEVTVRPTDTSMTDKLGHELSALIVFDQRPSNTPGVDTQIEPIIKNTLIAAIFALAVVIVHGGAGDETSDAPWRHESVDEALLEIPRPIMLALAAAFVLAILVMAFREARRPMVTRRVARPSTQPLSL